MDREPWKVDLHHHILPSYYLETLAKLGIGDAGGAAFHAWSPAIQLAAMDRAGIAVAMNSIAFPGTSLGDPKLSREMARRLNEELVGLVAKHPTRFGALATLPMPDVDATLAEIEHAFDTLKVDGVSMLTSFDGKYPGDPRFDAIFAELDRRKAVIHVHPSIPKSSKVLEIALPESLVEFVFDTTRMVANLIYSGTMEKYPNLKFVLSHAGGTVPFLAARFTLGQLVPELAAKAPQGAIAYLKRFYFDTAIATAPTALASLTQLVGPSHIVYGSDIPFLPEPLVFKFAAELAQFAGLDDAAKAAIERESGLALFPRLQQQLAAA